MTALREQFAEQLREQLREQLAERGVTEEEAPDGGNRILDELHRQLRAIAPEVIAGDGNAAAEAARIESEISREERRVRLSDLAAIEQAARDREAAEAEAEAKRQDAVTALAAVEEERNREVARADGLLAKLADALKRIHGLDTQVQVLGPQAEPGRPGYSFPRMLVQVEKVLAWDLFQVGIKDIAHVAGPRPVLPAASQTKAKAKRAAKNEGA